MRGVWVVVKRTKNDWTVCKNRFNSRQFFEYQKEARTSIDNLDYPAGRDSLGVAYFEASKIVPLKATGKEE